MTPVELQASDDTIQQLIAGLDSLVDGEQAAEQLVSLGRHVTPAVERYLLTSRPRSISVSRCRAVRILGALGAYSSLIRYLRENVRPSDAAVLFAEDAVRSAAALELMHCESPATFKVLLDAVKQRATSGLVQAVSQYRWPESVPVLFHLLEDDLCREDAKEALRKMPQATKAYGLLLLRGRTELSISGSSATRRRRATLQLLVECGIYMNEWSELRVYLEDDDLDCVILAATLGLRVAPPSEMPCIAATLIEASAGMNWAQETEIVELLDKWPQLAHQAARTILVESEIRGKKPDLRSPFWRTLNHFLRFELNRGHH